MTYRAAHKLAPKAKPTIYYPETDLQPIPDGEYQAPILVNVVSTLSVHFNKVPGARVNGNVFLYYEEGNPRKTIAPDCYVAFNLTAEAFQSLRRHNTYLIWEVGKPPEFVLEIGSPGTKRSDLTVKRDVYASIGVSEYWRYDERGGAFYGEPLVGERLVAGEYQRLPMRDDANGRVWAYSAALNLVLGWDDGELRFWDPVAEKWLLSYAERHALRQAAERRAAKARALAAEHRAIRLATEARIAELESQLRQQRGD